MGVQLLEGLTFEWTVHHGQTVALTPCVMKGLVRVQVEQTDLSVHVSVLCFVTVLCGDYS